MAPKLKNICEALDHGNYKQALKLATAFLQKQPSHTLCKALKALALEMSDRRAEALHLCNEVKAMKCADSQVLDKLQSVYKRCGLNDEVTNMYEQAWKIDPESEEYGVALFSSVTREADFQRQQQVAMKLYRKFNKPKYLHWVVVSILLQVSTRGAHRSLDLAEVLLLKTPVNVASLKRGSLSSRTQYLRSNYYLLLLHLATLRQQHKHELALETLENYEACVMLPSDFAQMRMRLLTEASAAKRAAEAALDLVLQNVDQWSSAQEYIWLAFQCEGGFRLETTPPPTASPTPMSPKLPGEKQQEPAQVPAETEKVEHLDFSARVHIADDAAVFNVQTLDELDKYKTADEVRNAFMLFKYLQRNVHQHSSRVPFLAELEIRKLAFCKNELESASHQASEGSDSRSWLTSVTHTDILDFIDAILAYYDSYGHLNSCYFDMKPYLCVLDDQKSSYFLTKLQQSFTSRNESDKEKRNAKRLEARRLLTLHRTQRGLRFLERASLEEMANSVNELLDRWDEYKPPPQLEGGSRDDAGEENLAGDLLGLAVATLLDMDRELCQQLVQSGHTLMLRDRVYYLDALALLEIGIKLSPHAWQNKVLLSLLYGAIGSAMPLRKWYETLGITCVQQESLSYLVLDRMLSLGWWDDAHEICRHITQFHSDFDKEMSDVLSFSFKEGVFHRISEYLETAETVRRSVVRGRAVVEQMLVDAMKFNSYQEISDFVGRNASQLHAIANQPTSYWTTSNQDRALLHSLHPLPRCTPLQSMRMEPRFKAGSSGMSTQPVRASLPRTVNCVAAQWPLEDDGTQATGSGGVRKGEAARAYSELSALELLLVPRLEASPGLLKLRAVMLLMAHAMLKSPPDEDELSRLLDSLQQTLVAQGLVVHCDHTLIFRGHHGGVPARSAPRNEARTSMVAPGPRPSTGYGPGDDVQVGGSSPVALNREKNQGHRDESSNGPALMEKVTEVEESQVFLESQTALVDPHAGMPPPWHPTLVVMEDLNWRCVLLTCDTAHRILQAVVLEREVEAQGMMGTLEREEVVRKQLAPEDDADRLLAELVSPQKVVGWEAARRGLAVLTILMKECTKQLHDCSLQSMDREDSVPGDGAEAREEETGPEKARETDESFRLGRHGITALSRFVSGPLLLLVPMVLWCSEHLPKVSHMGTRGAQEGLNSTRQALKQMITELTNALQTLHGSLMSAQNHCDLRWPSEDSPPTPQVAFCRPDRQGPAGDFQSFRRMVANNLASSHKKQLQELQKALDGRYHLLKNLYFRP